MALLGLDGDDLIMLVNADQRRPRAGSRRDEAETVREIATAAGVAGAALARRALLLTLTWSGDCTWQEPDRLRIVSDRRRSGWSACRKGMVCRRRRSMMRSRWQAGLQRSGPEPRHRRHLSRFRRTLRTARAFRRRLACPNGRDIAMTAIGGYQDDGIRRERSVPTTASRRPACSPAIGSAGCARSSASMSHRIPSPSTRRRHVRIAGVTYSGELLVYRMAPMVSSRGISFRPRRSPESNCISAVAFGGDGEALLFRHVDESLFYVAAVGNGANVGWHKAIVWSAPARGRIELTEFDTEDEMRRAGHQGHQQRPRSASSRAKGVGRVCHAR